MFRKIIQYLQNVKTEMSKVSWPKRDQLAESTGITLFLALILALFIFIADYIISRLVNILI